MPFLFAILEVNIVVMINGEKTDVDGKNLLEYLISFGYDTKHWAQHFVFTSSTCGTKPGA